MKHPLALLIPALLIASVAMAAPGMELAADGRAQAVIVLGPDATASEQTAANELAIYLKRSTGAEFEIVSDMPTHGQRIFVGQTAYVKQLLKGFDWSQVKRDGIVIRTIGDDLVLAGDRPRGSIYAVVTFLEDQLGVRWWAPNAETVPLHRSLEIGPLDIVYKPPFMYREAFFQAVNTDDADLPMHLKLNGHHQRIPMDKGGHYSILGWCHTFNQLLPPDKYFSEHPEWYAQINGKRTKDWAQLCLTDPNMKAEMVKQALGWIGRDPEAGIISISQNDWLGPCQCDKCSDLVNRTGGQSGALITFVNSVAEEIEKEYPDFLIETLAYQYTRHAPTGVKPRHNVIVRLCSIECNFAQPLDSKANADFYKDLTDWKGISEHLYVWDYVVNFNSLLIPHPNFRSLAPNIRAFEANNVVGLFEQGDAYNPSAALNPLKMWMIAKLLWNPDLDDRSLIKEFMDGYYGSAGPHMERYLRALTDAVRREKPSLGCFAENPRFYTARDLDRANDAMQKAIDAVSGDPVLLKRVRIQQMSLNNLLIITRRGLDMKGQEVEGVEWSTISDRFLKEADATGNIYSNEQTVMSDHYREMLRAQVITHRPTRIPDAPAPGRKGIDWVDLQESGFDLANEGVWVTVIPDDAASNGITCQMPGSSTQWAIQHPISAKDIIAPRDDIIVRARVDADGTSGMALRFGAYDPDAKADYSREVPLSEINGAGYHDYRVNGIVLKRGMYLYVAPCGNGAVKSVSVDRIFLVKSADR